MWITCHMSQNPTFSTSRGSRMSKSACLPFWETGESEGRGSESEPHIFESSLSQTNDFKIDTCHSLAWRSALLGSGKEWFAQYQDNATEWDSRSWCRRACVPVRQHYKVTMNVHCHHLVQPPPSTACLLTMKHSFTPRWATTS